MFHGYRSHIQTTTGTRALLALLALAFCSVLTNTAGCERASEDSRTSTVTFWTISLRPVFTEYINERIATFEAHHPSIDVRWVDVPFSSIERKLLAAAAARRAPDVINLSDMMFARYASAGAFVDLSDHLSPRTIDAYHDGALGVSAIDREQLALPWYLTTQALMYNAELLADGGLDGESLGDSWGELIEQAPGFFEETGTYLFTQPIGTDSQLLMMMLADGIAPFALDNDNLLRADLTSDRVISFLQRWVSLYQNGHLPRESATRGFEHLIDVYQNERVALVNTGPNFLERIKGVSPGVYAQTRVLPAVTGSLGSAHIAVMTVCVSTQSAHPDDAATWAAFITSPESQLMFCRLAAILPSTPAAMQDEFFSGPTDEERERGLDTVGVARSTVASTFNNARAFTPGIECWPDLRRTFERHFKRVLLEDADLRTEMQQAERAWQGILEAMNTNRVASGGTPAGAEALPRGVTVPNAQPLATGGAR